MQLSCLRHRGREVAILRCPLASVGLLLVAACSGTSLIPAPVGDAAANVADAADDVADANDAGDTKDCGTGTGGARWCCGAPHEAPGQNCMLKPPDGRCVGEGELIEGKNGEHCCEGLDRISLDEPTDAGCSATGTPSLFVCTRCGDGLCGVAENQCNCGADCRQ